MNQIERNIINSFNLAKHDIHMLKSQVQQLAEMQEKIIDAMRKLQLEQKKPVKVVKVESKETPKVVVKQARKKTHYVASKTGSKFHNENCPFAQNIKPKSKVRFHSKVKALNEGFKPCACINK